MKSTPEFPMSNAFINHPIFLSINELTTKFVISNSSPSSSYSGPSLFPTTPLRLFFTNLATADNQKDCVLYSKCYTRHVKGNTLLMSHSQEEIGGETKKGNYFTTGLGLTSSMVDLDYSPSFPGKIFQRLYHSLLVSAVFVAVITSFPISPQYSFAETTTVNTSTAVEVNATSTNSNSIVTSSQKQSQSESLAQSQSESLGQSQSTSPQKSGIPTRTIFDEEKELREKQERANEQRRIQFINAAYNTIERNASEGIDILIDDLKAEKYSKTKEFTRVFNHKIRRELMEPLLQKFKSSVELEKIATLKSQKVIESFTNDLIITDDFITQKDFQGAIRSVDSIRNDVNQFLALNPYKDNASGVQNRSDTQAAVAIGSAMSRGSAPSSAVTSATTSAAASFAAR